MKMMNFRRFDPNYEGKGLQRGNKDEKIVWELYSKKPHELSQIVTSIKSISDNKEENFHFESDDKDNFNIYEEDSQEGSVLTRVHKIRERNRSLVKKKKNQLSKKFGTLFCEVCGFNFSETYGN